MAKIGALRNGDHYKSAAEFAYLHAQPKFLPLSTPGFKSLLKNGLPRGILAEVNGRRSCGKTSALLHVLAQSTARGETCAVVDLFDNFDPVSASDAGVQLDRLVWVRCGGHAESAMRATDLLLHAGGFGVVLLDLCEANTRILNRIPLSYWYRFRRAVEHTPSILLVCADTPQARGSSVCLEFKRRRLRWSGKAPYALLRGIDVNATCKSAMLPPESLSVQVA